MKRDNLSFYEQQKNSRAVSIVSIPFEYGSDARGLREAPEYLLKSGLETMLGKNGFLVSSKETIDCPKNLQPTNQFPKYLDETAAVARAAFDVVRSKRMAGETVITLCGDHASAIGSIMGAACAGQRVGIIYFDAHPDIHTHETTITGNTHAMVVSSAIGKGYSRFTSLGDVEQKVRPEDVLYVGIKDFDENEPRLTRESGAQVSTMLEIALHGLSQVTKAIDELSQKVDMIWVSMDLDSVDKIYAPGVAMPCTDGFTRREITSLAQYIGKTCTIAGLDIVEILPANDVDQKTAGLAIELTARFLGGEYTWYRAYMDPYETKRKRLSKKSGKKTGVVAKKRLITTQ